VDKSRDETFPVPAVLTGRRAVGQQPGTSLCNYDPESSIAGLNSNTIAPPIGSAREVTSIPNTGDSIISR
jgi:hypothetical protein